MKIRVIEDRCQGHNRCYQLAQDMFDVDDYGTAHERHGGVVPPEMEAKVRLAIANCPEHAIEEVTD